jgi:signal transduction histidine kinase/DNA-binding response OmpR family regulator
MAVISVVPHASGRSVHAELFAQLQTQTVLITAPALFLAGAIIGFGGVVPVGDPGNVVLGLAIELLALTVLGLWRTRRSAAAWVLVLGCLAADCGAVLWGSFGPVVWLLIIPVGLASLAINLRGGTLLAAACTVGLLVTPSDLLAVDSTLRVTACLGLWSMVGMLWLTLRTIFTALDWAWSSHEHSQAALEQARDYQQQLRQTLEDLTFAHTQLTRLNRLVDGYRLAAEEARQAKERFVANVSHELRTPLNMITGFCEMITQQPETYGTVPEILLADLGVVLRNSRHLSDLIDDVLDLSQVDAGRMALAKERASLREIVEAAAVAVRPLFSAKQLALEIEVSQDLPPVFCDPLRIREVVLNLLSNAGRFTERGGVRVRAWRDSSDVIISVADTGPGIEPEDQARLFQPFHQVDNSIRRRYGGTGLGLSISKSFAELHGGRMWVESTVGCGTTFFFRLPIELPPVGGSMALRWYNPHEPYEGRASQPKAPSTAVRPRVLVVEHGCALQRLLSRYMDQVEVAAAPDLEEAARDMARIPAQLLVVNDAQVDRALQKVLEAPSTPGGVPAIICSVPGTEQAADALGAVDYLLKPIRREALMAALERVGPHVKTVLLVEDEPDAIQLFRRMLTSTEREYRVLRAFDGHQALEILAKERPDVILLDLVMPGMDGFRFLAERHQNPAWRDLPVILISARDPLGQPVASNAVAVTAAGGISLQQLVACIEALSSILGQSLRRGQAPTATPDGSPAFAESQPRRE